MPEITRRIEYYSRGKGPTVRMLHIETEGAVVNITVGLRDEHGRKVTRVDVNPDDETRGGDGQGDVWQRDGARVIRQARCRHCGDRIDPDPMSGWAAETWRGGQCPENPESDTHEPEQDR